MPRYPRRSRKSTKAPKRKYARRVYKKKSSSLVKTIKKVIHQQAENKVNSTYAANQVLNYAGSVTNPFWINLTPTPTQGTTVQQRIGNQIRVMKGVCNGFVNVRPYDATYNTQVSPIMIKMWLCRRQTYNSQIGGIPGTTDFSNFFQSGATSLGFQSNMLDMTLKNNRDYWNVFATKTVTLQSGYYGGATAPTTAIIGSAYKCHAPFSFSFAKHLGLCKYNDNTTYPTNKELYLVFQPVYADGSSSVSPLILAECHYTVEWQYEDV